ncbi:MAG: energy transducer TonB [Myxococcota bacterium]
MFRAFAPETPWYRSPADKARALLAHLEPGEHGPLPPGMFGGFHRRASRVWKSRSLLVTGSVLCHGGLALSFLTNHPPPEPPPPPSVPVLLYQAPPPPPPPPPPPAATVSKPRVKPIRTPSVRPELTVPKKEPEKPAEPAPEPEPEAAEPEPAGEPGGVVGGVAGGVVGGVVGGQLGGQLPPKKEPPPKPAPVAAKAVRRSGEVRQARLLHRVEPVYPQQARTARTEGRVVLMLIVDASGRVTDARVLSGPTLLAQAAKQAVLQWRFDPGRNGDGNAVISQILQPIDFRLR